MWQSESSQVRPTEPPPSAWAVGFTFFAGVTMIIVGVFHALYGLAAIFEDTFFVVTEAYLYRFDVTTWGWIQLGVGVLVALAGLYLFTGAVWARAIGVILAGLSAIVNFMSLPYAPVWSILIIALDIFVIWALTVHGRDVTSTTSSQ